MTVALRLLQALSLVLLLSAGGPVGADAPLRIAAAADLRYAMDEIVEDFRRAWPAHQVEVIYGSSGRFRAQIENGAPFDLYFSADISYPEALRRGGHVAGEVVPYGIGRLVLWSSTVDAAALTPEDLRRGDFRRIAIANPRHAPYGMRAREALRALGLWEEVEARLVFGENIAQTLQLVQSGAAEVGIIALSLARNPAVARQGGYHLIDDRLHQPLKQGFVITRHAEEKAAAWRFAEHLSGERARHILRAYGFALPGDGGGS